MKIPDEHIHWMTAIPLVLVFTGLVWCLRYIGLEFGVFLSTWIAAGINFAFWGGREWYQAYKKYGFWVPPIDWSRQKQIEFMLPLSSGTLTSCAVTLIATNTGGQS